MKFKTYVSKYYNDIIAIDGEYCYYIGKKNNSIEDEITELTHTPITEITNDRLLNIKRKLDEQIQHLKNQIDKKTKIVKLE